MASNREVIPVVHGLKKTVKAGVYLDSLVPKSTDYYLLPEGATPLFSVSYDDIDLSGIEKVHQLAKDNVYPLKNFLWRKKKEQSNNESNGVLSVYGVINKDNDASYGVAVEPTLIEKLQLALQSPELSVNMVVSYMGVAYGFSLSLDGMTRFKLASGIGSDAITKQALENVARSAKEQNRRISFQLTVNIKCMGVQTTNMAPKIDLAMTFAKLFDLPDSSKDVTIVALNQAEIKAHKCILMAQSPAFLSMLDKDTGMTEVKSGRILMKDNSAEGITMFVRCLYGFEVPVETISPDLALELFQLSHKYGICELEKGLKNFFTRKDVEWYTVDSLLELYFYVKNLPSFEDLADHALFEMSKLDKQSLESSDYFEKLGREDERDLLLELWNWK